MSKLLLTFYGDDFTGSTDALEQLTLAGIRTMLFIKLPSLREIKKFPGLQAIGVAGLSRSLAPQAQAKELRRYFRKFKMLRPRHVHYKVCSTFDSSPAIGSIGQAIDLGASFFPGQFVPVLAAAPALGRYTVFGQHFARYGIGSAGQIHRLDRHPSISRHPVTPMTEADLTVHLGRQTKKRIGLFDILSVARSKDEARAALEKLIANKNKVILFDAMSNEHISRIGELLEEQAAVRSPLFSVGSSGIEAALATQFNGPQQSQKSVEPVSQILVGSGSCSPVTSGQIAWALKHGFAEVAIDAGKLTGTRLAAAEIKRTTATTVALLQAGRSVIVHTTRHGSDKRVMAKLKGCTSLILGTALGKVMRKTIGQSPVRRLCIAGGDTSSFAARALGIEALEMLAPLTPGAPLCRAHAPGSPVDGREIVFKGGQVGAENYFETVLKGNS
ncbi:MAG TPA: four-carbon acid sugar kinase family protein [Verrucomicrobiae bacterium]|nr:four-carbon acid sugar kinase family protein [Verrucomicrobiae bacterium]